MTYREEMHGRMIVKRYNHAMTTPSCRRDG